MPLASSGRYSPNRREKSGWPSHTSPTNFSFKRFYSGSNKTV